MIITKHINRFLVVNILNLFVLFFLAISVVLIFRLEDAAFDFLNYIVKGPQDISFWFLALVEFILGATGFHYTLKWCGYNKYKDISSSVTNIKLLRWKPSLASMAIGAFFGLGLSGLWKIVYLIALFLT